MEDREKWNKCQGIRDEAFARRAKFPSGDKSGHLWGTVTHSAQSPCGNLSCFVITHAMLHSHGSCFWVSTSSVCHPEGVGKICFFLLRVSSLGGKQCLEICALPWSDVPISWGESILSSHTHLFGVQHEAAQHRVSCPQGSPVLLLYKRHAHFDLLAVLASWQHLQPREGHGWKDRADCKVEVWHQDKFPGTSFSSGHLGFTAGLPGPWRVPALKQSPPLLNWLGSRPSSIRKRPSCFLWLSPG